MLRRVCAVPKNYDWGTPDAIALLRGGAPTGAPEAEVWFGPHPLSNCTIDDGASEPFDRWLARTGHDFPLLVKFLAASRPLSIQVHPSAWRAEEGFHREEGEGVALDDPRRTFKDSLPKPELLVCLSNTFDILWGFHTPEGLRAKFTSWEHSGLDAGTAAALHGLAERPLRDAVPAMMSAVAGDDGVARQLGEWGREWTGAGIPTAVELERHVIHRLETSFPGDPGIVVAAFMHTRRLSRGEAVCVQPGEVHAYVEGFGLEVMLPSDNVARAGLTSKHRDTELFLSVATLEGSESVPTIGLGAEGIVPGSDAFPWELRVLEHGSVPSADRDSLVVIERGPLSLPNQGSLDAGYAYFVPAGEQLPALDGDGVAWHVIPRTRQD